MDSFDGSTVVTGYASIAFIIAITRMLKPLVLKYSTDELMPLVTLVVAVLWNTLFTWIDGGDPRTGLKIGLLAGVFASGVYSYAKATGVADKLEDLNPFKKKENQ